MKFSGQLNAEDLIAYRLWKGRFQKWFLYLLCVVASAMILLYPALQPEPLSSTLISIFPFVFFFFLTPVYNRFFLPGKIRRHFLDSGLDSPVEYKLTPDFFLVRSSETNGEFPWSDLQKFAVTPGFVILYNKAGLAYIFPRRWFTDEQFAEFKGYLQSALGKSGRSR